MIINKQAAFVIGLIAFLIIGGLCAQQRCSAYTNCQEDNYNGYGNIIDYVDACDFQMTGNRTAALWIGEADNPYKAEITIDEGQEEVGIALWGISMPVPSYNTSWGQASMIHFCPASRSEKFNQCPDGARIQFIRFGQKDTNSAGFASFARASWQTTINSGNYPSRLPATLDVNDFIKGAAKEEKDGYTQYMRDDIVVKRCLSYEGTTFEKWDSNPDQQICQGEASTVILNIRHRKIDITVSENKEVVWTRPKLEKTIEFKYGINYTCVNKLSWTIDPAIPNHDMLSQNLTSSGWLGGDEDCKGSSSSLLSSINIIAGNSDVGTSTEFSKQISVTAIGNGTSSESKNATSFATVNVPYNFQNSIKISDDTTKKVFYAGTDVKVRSKITVSPKKNSLVGGDEYATIVREAKVKYIITQNGATEETPEINIGELNKNGNLAGNKDDNDGGFEQSIPIKDLPAGQEVCIKAAIYPASSGADDNLGVSGDNTWAYSEPICVVVAKHPSFQVWGGIGIYSSGNIESKFINKTNAGDYNGIYGSWSEHAIIANGTIDGMASSAAIAKNGTKSSNPICDFSELTFANNGCKLGKVGITHSNNNFGEAIASIYSSSAIFYSSNSSLGESKISSGYEIHLAKNPDTNDLYDIAINGNQEYDSEATYASLESMPKRIIYAKNIYINCSVTRIDAILVAEETINTCADANGLTPEENSKERSNQLVVNGMIIAKKLLLNRTYGAATGEYSGVPAEIFNHYSSVYFWGGESSNQDTKNYSQIYYREISPRY